MIYAVIDTNVLVSALITHNHTAATSKVVTLLLEGFLHHYMMTTLLKNIRKCSIALNSNWYQM